MPQEIHHPGPQILAGMSPRDLNAHVAAVTTAYEDAKRRLDDACQAYGETLTELIAREALAKYPTAHTMRVRLAVEFHTLDDGDIDPECEGHNERLVIDAVLDAAGNTLSDGDDLCKVADLLEQLTPIMPDQADLVLPTRTWHVASDDDVHSGHYPLSDADVYIPPISDDDLAQVLTQWAAEQDNNNNPKS